MRTLQSYRGSRDSEPGSRSSPGFRGPAAGAGGLPLPVWPAAIALFTAALAGCAQGDDVGRGPAGLWRDPPLLEPAGEDPPADAATSTMAEPRVDHDAVVLHSGKVLVFGGATRILVEPEPLRLFEDTLLTSTALYDPATGTWAPAAPRAITGSVPASRVMVLQDGRVLVASGVSFELYNPALDVWTSTARMPTARAASTCGTAMLADGRVLVAGGRVLQGPSPSRGVAEIYDPATNTWSATTPMLTAMNAVRGAISLKDGRVLVSDGVSRSELFDPVSATWTLGPSLRFKDIVSLSDGKVLMILRHDGPDAFSSVYDPVTDTQTEMPPFALPAASGLVSPALTALRDGRALFTGGYTPETNSEACIGTSHPWDCPVYYKYSGAVWMFDPVAQRWTPAAPMRLPRAGHTATQLLDGAVLIAGGDVVDIVVIPGLVSTTNAELYVLSTSPLGAPCDDGASCDSGFCVDGVCCDAACDAGPCDACVVVAGASEDGRCAPLTGTACDDRDACTDGDICQAGACAAGAVDICGSGGEGGSAGAGGSSVGEGGSAGAGGSSVGEGGSAGAGGSSVGEGGSAGAGGSGGADGSAGAGGSSVGEGGSAGAGGSGTAGSAGEGGSSSDGAGSTSQSSGGDPEPSSGGDGDHAGGGGAGAGAPDGGGDTSMSCRVASPGQAPPRWLGALSLLGVLGLRRRRSGGR
ncbi:Kelch repeat-containing protein [Sorangium sp. So ce124]|uniref:Kelch repeat-containing protein n=1 Tax=Sorangium sp. So ce124 TaxID=3133280 RepID=UPI003F5F3FC0